MGGADLGLFEKNIMKNLRHLRNLQVESQFGFFLLELLSVFWLRLCRVRHSEVRNAMFLHLIPLFLNSHCFSPLLRAALRASITRR